MSGISIKRVSTKSELKDFVRFNYELYKDCPYAVPDFLEDTLNTFDAKSNAAFEFCDAEFFIAYRQGKIVGKVAIAKVLHCHDAILLQDEKVVWA